MLFTLGIFLSLYIISLYFYYIPSGMADYRSSIILLIILLILLLAKLPPLLRNRIVIDDQTISGRIGKNRFSLRWRDVVAVWEMMLLNQTYMKIGARDQKITIPVKWFEENLLRELIRRHVAPEAFEKDAIKQMMGFRVRDAANERIIEQADKNLRVGAMFVKGVGLACGLFSLLLVVWSWLDGEDAVSLFFLIFVALGAYMILASGSMEVNKDSITYITPIGAYRIRWDDITEIEIEPLGGNMVVRGRNKVLSLLGHSFWSGKDKEQMLRLFSAQIGNRDIAVKEAMDLTWPRNKNTRIRSKSQ